MIYLYKDPKGDKIFGKTSSWASSVLNSAAKRQQQQQNSIPLTTLTSADNKEGEELKEKLEDTICEKERIATEQEKL